MRNSGIHIRVADIIYGVIKHRFLIIVLTVAGLLTGKDLIGQLQGRDLGSRLLITEHMLKSGEPVFLDDVTVEELEKTLQIKVSIVKSGGNDLISSIIE